MDDHSDPRAEYQKDFAELRQRLEDFDQDRKQQYRELYELADLTGLSIDSLTRMRPDEIAIAVEVATEQRKPSAPTRDKFDVSKFPKKQKLLAMELNNDENGWISFDEGDQRGQASLMRVELRLNRR